jgi:hypothetical protein
LVGALRAFPNWYLDLANERNLSDARFASYEDLAELRALARKIDPARLVTASHAGDLRREDVRRYLREVKVDFLSPHRPRHAGSPGETEAKTREVLRWVEELGGSAPLHYQEPFRRDFGSWQPMVEDYRRDLAAARAGGAAGWCLHNGDRREAKDGRPRRSFDLSEGRLIDGLDPVEREVLKGLAR